MLIISQRRAGRSRELSEECGVSGSSSASSSARTPEQILRRQQAVHRPGAKAFQIESHKLEAESFEYFRELPGHIGIERPLQFLASDFNADDLAVVTHAELPEPQRPQRVFTLLHHPEGLSGNRPSIFDAGREAGRSRLVPDAQAGTSREGANLFFGEARIQQRSDDVVRARSLLAGTEVALVVEIYAVRDGVKATRRAQFFHQGE